MADIYIGNIKGPQGVQGETGEQGVPGEAATIEVGTVSTTAYGNTAQVINSGTSSEAVFDFVIPQGRPGEETTQMSALTLDTVTAQSAEFPIPATGESGATVFGKIIKFFNDAKTAINSKINISDIVNNLTSTATNKPLSAAQGKALNDALVQSLAVKAITIEQSVDVAASGNVSITFQKPSVAGYAPLLFVYSGANTSNLVPTSTISSYFYADTRIVNLRNITSTRITGNVQCSAFVLLVKTAMNGGIK